MEAITEVATRMLPTGAMPPAQANKSNDGQRLWAWQQEVHHSLLRDPEADPAAVAAERGWVCPFCGGLMPPVRFQQLPDSLRQRGLWIRPTRHGCAAEVAHLEAVDGARQRAEREEREERWAGLLRHCGLGGQLGQCTFKSFQARPDWPAAVQIKTQCADYINGLLRGQIPDSKNWLVLVGQYGAGKSHLAAAMVRQALEHGTRAYFRVWPAYLERLKLSWDKGAEEKESGAAIVKELTQGWLVVLDDVEQAHDPNGWGRRTLFSFINQRYNEGLPTVFTFNHDLGDADPLAPGRLIMERVLGHAVLDRVIERAHAVVRFDGASHRSGVRWMGGA